MALLELVVVAVGLVIIVGVAINLGHHGDLLGHLGAAVDDRTHIGGHIGTLAAAPAKDDDSHVGERLGLVHNLIGVMVHGGFGQREILPVHPDGGALGAILGVHISEGGVGSVASLGQGFQDAHLLTGH